MSSFFLLPLLFNYAAFGEIDERFEEFGTKIFCLFCFFGEGDNYFNFLKQQMMIRNQRENIREEMISFQEGKFRLDLLIFRVCFHLLSL